MPGLRRARTGQRPPGTIEGVSGRPARLPQHRRQRTLPLGPHPRRLYLVQGGGGVQPLHRDLPERRPQAHGRADGLRLHLLAPAVGHGGQVGEFGGLEIRQQFVQLLPEFRGETDPRDALGILPGAPHISPL